MAVHYQPQQIESEAQAYWDKQQTFVVRENSTQDKFYCLSMFPYPSGHLHVGHVRNYTIADVIARYQKMQGKNVLQPFGWDAFGLPAENAAIQRKIAPATWTYKNISHMKQQLKALGFGIDWSREFATCDPEYYRWEQWFFIKLFAKGIAYRKKAMLNWDPVDQTVLANEQVVDGKGWRSGAPIERKEFQQWFLKITDYADELLDNLDTLDGWPEKVKLMQKNWIGRSEGTDIIFETNATDKQSLTTFTTRADTLFGVSYLCVAPEHALATQAAQSNAAIASFINECKHIKVAEADIANLEKRGMDTGFKAIHPMTGNAMPIWIANYVLSSYGSGAVMAVPAHDQRDFEFAQKYQLPINRVITPKRNETPDALSEAYIEYGFLVDSGEFNGLSSQEAKKTICSHLEKHNKGKAHTAYRLRDWGISRQRYWGTPIPIIYCEHCGTVPVPETELPVKLPENIQFDGSIPSLSEIPTFYQTQCPQCKKPARRETDTFDTFMESSWYYLRYACPELKTAMLDQRANHWTPVDQYIGGIEHAVMHLLYVRFMHKLLRDQGLVHSDEPIQHLLTQGMVLKDGSKMSKSKGNTIDPEQLIQNYGADSLRLFIIFTAPPEQSLEWSDSGFEGMYRFLKRLYAWAMEHKALLLHDEEKNLQHANAEQKEHYKAIHLILKQAQHDYDRLQLNTVVSSGMKLFNVISKITPDNTINQWLITHGLRILLQVIAPIAPHICHHLWLTLGYGSDILQQRFPQWDQAALETEAMQLIVQVNGKLRCKINVPSLANENEIKALALSNANIQKFIADQKVKKVIYVAKRLLNFVV